MQNHGKSKSVGFAFPIYNQEIKENRTMKRGSFLERMRLRWQTFTIKNKILAFTGIVFLIISMSVLFNILIVKFSMVDFSHILSENYKCNNFVQAIETEIDLFEDYTKDPDEENGRILEEAIAKTKEAVYELTFEYSELGEVRYAYTWEIRSSYEVYAKHRDELLNGPEDQENYIDRLYEVYDMQAYLQKYGNALMDETIAASSEVYQEKVPAFIILPWIVIGAAFLLIICMTWLSKAMNHAIVVPVMKLVDTSKKIAANEFQIEDVEVENKDELGELVQAFNKMKYSTREYIAAMEENRETLGRLHDEEVQRLEAERRLETMQLEALKNQINPHFLFNTLNVIGGMAMLENAETTNQMIKALSSLFRYNLQSADTETSLMRELKIVHDYMYIQQMRFGDRISYEIECMVDEEQTKVPTLTFQPLVENAIIHGVSKKEEGGKVYIRIWEEDAELKISVKDTGIGMNTEALEKVKARLNEKYGYSNIGIGNVYRRMKLAYPDSSMDISSVENEGTTIEITIRK